MSGIHQLAMAVPTQSLTVLGCHMDGTNGSTTITDSSGRHTLTAANGAQISTAQSKFGGASALFDGVDDYISSAASSDWAFGTADFTIDGWFYSTTGSGERSIIACLDDATSEQWNLEAFGGSIRFTGWSSVYLTAASAYSLNTWTHVEVSRSESTLKMFIDGVQVDSVTNTTSFTLKGATVPLVIGAYAQGTGFFWNGYLDDLRITKFLARHTSGFTPPAAPFS